MRPARSRPGLRNHHHGRPRSSPAWPENQEDATSFRSSPGHACLSERADRACAQRVASKAHHANRFWREKTSIVISGRAARARSVVCSPSCGSVLLPQALQTRSHVSFASPGSQLYAGGLMIGTLPFPLW